MLDTRRFPTRPQARRRVKQLFKALPMTLVAFLFWAISLSFNLQTGYDYGAGDIYMIVTYMSLAFAGDAGKAIVGASIGKEIARGQWLQVLSSLAILVLCIALSLFSAFKQRINSVEAERAERTALTQQRADLRGKIEPLQLQVREAAIVRPLAVIETDLARTKKHRRYRTSEGCTNATAPASVNLCKRVSVLEAEKRLAVKLPGLQAELGRLEKQWLAIPVASVKADPAAAAIRDILVAFGYDKDTSVDSITGMILVAATLMVEIIATLMPMKQAAQSGRPVNPAGKEKAVATVAPADGRKLKRHEALDWIMNRALNDERVHWVDEDTFLATNTMLAQVWGRPRSTANDWLTVFAIDKKIAKKATARGMEITVLA